MPPCVPSPQPSSISWAPLAPAIHFAPSAKLRGGGEGCQPPWPTTGGETGTLRGKSLIPPDHTSPRAATTEGIAGAVGAACGTCCLQHLFGGRSCSRGVNAICGVAPAEFLCMSPIHFHFSPVLMVIYEISPSFYPHGQRADDLKGHKKLPWDKNSQAGGGGAPAHRDAA